jgi:hypothetical protein
MLNVPADSDISESGPFLSLSYSLPKKILLVYITHRD